ncbi:MAG: hypothetical protein HYR72_26990 [Deltaproteobacteria bacterium]|nr:hypothetical protein [Deltaproteobacteria bacterium]MBI3390339.1 hypothetical protein [Deltaproteobacteria bacterium]
MPRGGIETAHRHWSHLIEGLQASPKDFYKSVAAAIKRREIPDCKIGSVQWPEGGWFSARRLYLRVRRGKMLIDICGAPFGTGFFASSWLCLPPPSILVAVVLTIFGFVFGFGALLDLMRRNPMQTFTLNPPIREQIIQLLVMLGLDVLFVLLVVIFGIIRPLFFPPRPTYYRIDTATMFYTAVQQALKEVIDDLCKAQGVRLLTEEEWKPIMRGFGR